MSNLESKLKSFRIEPQPAEKTLENMKKLKAHIGMSNVRSNEKELREILKRAGSLADEIIELRKQERD